MREIWGVAPPDTVDTASRQVLFEGAVLAVLARVLDAGSRIDLAVNEYLDRFPMDSDGPHVRADLIICVSDCLNLLSRGQPDQSVARLILDEASRVWHGVRACERLESDRTTTTRVQACIGNIRRAIEVVSL